VAAASTGARPRLVGPVPGPARRDIPVNPTPSAGRRVGASAGISTPRSPVKDPTTGPYRIYVASLNLASINVTTSTDDGATFSQFSVQAGVPVDDREGIAAYGPKTSLLRPFTTS
jgi:hypothetical protein